MDKGALHITGFVLAGIGFVGTCAVAVMPQWRVTAFIGSNIVVFEALWEGLWMNCYRQVNIRIQCKLYDSLLALTPDLQAGRALMCTAMAMEFLAFMITVFGMMCTQCARDNERAKGLILMMTGIAFIFSGIVVLIPVSWTAYSIIRDFYNPLIIASQKRELGDAIYIGWVTALCLVAGGVILCCFCPRTVRKFKYSLPSKAKTSEGVVR